MRNKRGNSSASPSPSRGSEEVTLKLLCVGAASTGKSTFLKYWETKEVHHIVRTTIQMEFHKQEMDIFLPPPGGFEANPSSSPMIMASSSNFAQTDGTPSGSSSPTLGGSVTKRASSVAGNCYRLATPEVRTNYGPLTDRRRAIVKVWDIQGQESTKLMTRIFYTGAVGALIFCELTNTPESLESAVLWKQDIDAKVRVPKADGSGEQGIPCWLVANKYDLIKDMPNGVGPSWATRQLLDQFAAQHGFVGWSYAAGLKGINVSETVASLVGKCVERFPEEIRNQTMAPPSGQSGGVVLQRTRRPQKQDNGCCNRQ